MKRLTLCITGMLATAMAAWGCADDTPADERGGPGGDGSGGDGSGRSTTNAGSGDLSSCPAQTSSSVASHIVIAVSWPASLAIEAGEGEVQLWTKADLTFHGNVVSGTVRPCGSVIPVLTKTAAIGGGSVQVEIPGSVWDAPTMPVFQVSGTTSGFAVGSTIAMDPIASIVGLTMGDPMHDPWPAQASQVTTTDDDGDGQPGIKSIPRTDPPFSAPPVDLDGHRADEIDLTTRTVLGLTGTRDSCTTAKGSAQVSRVDSHIVGCHVRGNGRCTAAQSDFIDVSQPQFTIKSATFQMADVRAAATCAEVRTALPAH
jgi:hypothetical protein